MSTTNYSDPRSYPMLAKLLDTPETLELVSMPTTLGAIRRAVDAALLLPPEEPREDLLRALNGAVSDACHRRQYYQDKQLLVAQLKSSYPNASDIRDATQAIRTATCAIKDAVHQVEVNETPRGHDVKRTCWSAFVHELDRLGCIINHRMRLLERTAGITTPPEYAEDTAQSDAVCPTEKEACQ